MTLVTVSASYGAGGSRIAPAVARRLAVPFLDRAIPAEVSERLDVPLAEAIQHDEAVGGVLERLLASLAPLGQIWTGPLPPIPPDRSYVDATREVILEQAATGSGVILGHGASHVLAENPRVLNVRLDGPVAKRIRHAMELEHLDESAARAALERTDRARDAYLHHFHGGDPHDTGSYHLVLDTTAIPEDVCVDLIVLAAESHERALAP